MALDGRRIGCHLKQKIEPCAKISHKASAIQNVQHHQHRRQLDPNICTIPKTENRLIAHSHHTTQALLEITCEKKDAPFFSLVNQNIGIFGIHESQIVPEMVI